MIRSTGPGTAGHASPGIVLFAIAFLLAGASFAEAGEFGFNTIFADGQKDVELKQVTTQVTLSDASLLKSITAYIKGPPPKAFRYAIYADNAGEPGSLIAETAVTALTGPSYNWYTIATPDTAMSWSRKMARYVLVPAWPPSLLM